jgi:hypothetical protein
MIVYKHKDIKLFIDDNTVVVAKNKKVEGEWTRNFRPMLSITNILIHLIKENRQLKYQLREFKKHRKRI